MTVTLVTYGKTNQRKDFVLAKGSTVIGRKTDADLRIPLTEISRAHCELTMNGAGVTLRDLGSSNGTYVNGERVDDDYELAAGDKIRLGSVMFVVQIDGEPEKITPAMFAPPAPPANQSAAGRKAEADSPTMVGDASDLDDEIDIDELDDLDMDDLSDIDLSDEDSGELEELSEDDLIDDDEK